ncbi:MAG: uroporphyrinogen-III synthase [Xanthomonadales bacterium]|nr:uroporphyrinogen-III synthase [Xanthomonadales bacterium]
MSTAVQSLVLITRPLPKGQELGALLKTAGIDSLIAPAFEIQLREGNYLREYRQFLQAPDLCLIFPSVNAVVGFMQGLQSAALSFPAQAMCIAVGPATAEALKVHGANNISRSKGITSEALLALPEIQQAANSSANIAIIAAPGGRDLIEKTLQSRGYTVQKITVYKRHTLALPTEANSIIASQISLNSVFTSSLALKVAFTEWPEQIAAKLIKGQALVLSKRLQKQALEYGIKTVRVSSATDNLSICAQIVQQIGASAR